MSRLDYLLYRCFNCGLLLTCLEIEKTWDEAEKNEEETTAPICVCGSTKTIPTNMTPDEEKRYTSLWQRIRYFLGFRDNETKIVELYHKRVKGKKLGPLYGEEA